MNVTCNAGQLYEVLQLLLGVTDSRSPRAILQDLKIEAAGKAKLHVYATDLEIAIRCIVGNVNVKQMGVVVTPAASLSSILREIVEEDVELALEEKQLRVQGEHCLYRLPTDEPGEFPELPEFPGEGVFKVGTADLGEMIKHTAFAVAAEQTRYALNGVLFATRRGRLELVACDGRRLSRIARKAAGIGDRATRGIVPTKAVNEMLKMIGLAEGSVELAISSNQIWAKTKTAVLSSRLVEGQFPDYEAIIPSKDKLTIKMVFEREKLQRGVRQASLLADEETRSVEFMFEPKRALLKYQGVERGEAEVEVDVGYEGEPFSITFNPAYFTDVLKVLDTDTVELLLQSPEEAGLLRGGEEFEYVMMPICRSEE